eukprot:scaffold304076_cov26-Tisochrysis_lutea.AAC.1
MAAAPREVALAQERADGGRSHGQWRAPPPDSQLPTAGIPVLANAWQRRPWRGRELEKLFIQRTDGLTRKESLRRGGESLLLAA